MNSHPDRSWKSSAGSYGLGTLIFILSSLVAVFLLFLIIIIPDEALEVLYGIFFKSYSYSIHKTLVYLYLLVLIPLIITISTASVALILKRFLRKIQVVTKMLVGASLTPVILFTLYIADKFLFTPQKPASTPYQFGEPMPEGGGVHSYGLDYSLTSSFYEFLSILYLLTFLGTLYLSYRWVTRTRN